MGKTLIICEKPSAAAKIASALAEKKPKKEELDGVPYYQFKRDGKELVVVPALGHLFTLKNIKPMHDYPTYDIKWVPAYEADKRAERSRSFVRAIQELAEDAEEFINATDYDLEGAVIGYNILKYLCGNDAPKRARRMKFSTLTTEELQKAYQNLLPKLDSGLVDSGLARHLLDWYWGMNLSKAMSAAVEAAYQRFAKLSAGRVQTPTLKILLEREREIQAFKPQPYWVIGLLFEIKGQTIEASHKTEKFFDKKKAEKVRKTCEGKPAKVTEITTRKYRKSPPVPFDLGQLQSEAYRCFGYTPARTQQLAQGLYDAALISYPRTSSQKLPPAIGYAEIIRCLGRIRGYKELAKGLLEKKELKPCEGRKTDPAHPAIYPTGEKPKGLRGPRKKLYDLIARRFFSTFGDRAVKESIRVDLDIAGQPFYMRGHRILEKGWLTYYGPYGATDEVLLPKLEKDQKLVPKKLIFEEKETQPPPRYNPASIVKEMETRNLGTKCLCGNVPVLTSNFRALTLREIYENSYLENKREILSVPSPRKLFKRANTGTSFESERGQMLKEPGYVTCLAFNPATLELTKKRALPSKRQTRPLEKVLSIRTKYGSVEATSDHPIFVLQGGKITCKKAAEIKASDKLLAYIPHNQFEGDEIKLEKTSFIYGVSEKLGEKVTAKRKELKLTQDELAKLLGVSQTTVHAYENGSKVPISVLTRLGITPQFVGGRSTSGVIPNPFPIRMGSQLARLLGRLTGDGGFGTAQFKNENSCDFRYWNTEPSMIQSFIQDVTEIFKVRPKAFPIDKRGKKRIYQIRLPGVIGRILLNIAPEIVKHQIPKIVLNDRRLWGDYLSALFDDEATVPTGELKLRFTQKSKKLIFQIISILKELGIRTSRPRPENGSWKFGIYGRKNIENFLLRVGLTHPTKFQRLLKSARKYSSIRKKAMIYCLLSKGFKPSNIALELRSSAEVVRTYLRELVLDGLVDRSRKSLGRGMGSMSECKVKVPFGTTFYALLDAEIMTNQLCCKPVHAIQHQNLPRFVYDLSVGEETPAFVAGIDNIIVHNSTRAPILQNVYDRNYITGNRIEVTELGAKTIESLLEYCPEISSEDLTAHFEREMEAIQEGKHDKDEVLEEAKEKLGEILEKFRKRQIEIGKILGEAYRKTIRKQKMLGECPECGGQMKIVVSRRTKKRFAGCLNYPKCNNSYPLPQRGYITALDKTCPECGTPMIQVKPAGRRPYRMCLDPNCVTKADWGKKKKGKKTPRKESSKKK